MIVRSIFYLLISLFVYGDATGQKQKEEYLIHLESIYESSVPIREYGLTVPPKDTFFVDHVIQNYLEKPEFVKFISNRNLLKKIKVKICHTDFILMADVINSIFYEIEISLGQFDSTQADIKIDEKNNLINSINGQIPYGGEYAMPTDEISSIKIKINENEISIPDTAYRNLFNARFCEYDFIIRSISAYPSLDGKYLYLYIYGGGNASLYISKLIFNHEKYVTRIVVDYWDLSSYGSFREGFIGF